MSHPIIKTYKEASQVIEQLGILPLSRFIPDHPSLDSITEPDAWHTGADTDPWHWRDRFASEGLAAYGRFIGSRPILISRGIFPLMHNLLASPQTVDERYSSGLLARSTVQIYEIIQQNHGIEVRRLRKLAGMPDKADKDTFDRALIDLQNTAEILISGVAENRNDQGAKSGWNGACYMLAERWMEEHNLQPSTLTTAAAATQLLAWLQPRWEATAIQYLQKKLPTLAS